MVDVRPVHFFGSSVLVTVIYVCISTQITSVSHLATKLVLSNRSASVSMQHLGTLSPASHEALYDEIKCIMEHSNATCSFPLLADYHARCGHFAESTSWVRVMERYPKAVMSADLCRVPPVTSAPQSLREFIKKRNITGIVLFGDSQGR